MENSKKEIGKRIKLLREELGLSQEELAKLIGYTSASSRSTINKVELGINDVAQSKLSKYAMALNTTVEYLIGITDNPHSHSVTDNHGVIGNVNGSKITFKNNDGSNSMDDNLSAQETDLLRIFRVANGKQQLRIMNIAYAIEEEMKDGE